MRKPGRIAIGLGLALGALLPAPGLAQPAQPIGERFHVTVGDLPPPYATPSVARPAIRVPRPPFVTLRVPQGFTANVFAEGFRHARWLAVAATGEVFLAEPRAGRITVLADADGDGVAERRAVFARGLDRPHGLAFHGGYLYVGEQTRVRRLSVRPGNPPTAGPIEPVTAAAALGRGGGHWTRNLVFAADGASFFVTVGSRDNVAEEAPPRATVQRFRTDGTDQQTFATGLRNPVGIARQPGTDEIYVVVNERDGLGDGLVPDYLTRVRPGAFYGWPYAYSGPIPDPDYGDLRPDLVARTVTPDVLFKAHSAPLGLIFYDADGFPPAYRGDAFVALHGSWNSGRPTGYKIVRVPFRNGRPVGGYETFAAGFWLGGKRQARVWGRPVGLAVARDGSLLIADDVGQTIWRVAYQGG